MNSKSDNLSFLVFSQISSFDRGQKNPWCEATNSSTHNLQQIICYAASLGSYVTNLNARDVFDFMKNPKNGSNSAAKL